MNGDPEKAPGAAVQQRTVCPACRRPLSGCLCPEVKPFDCGVRFVFLQHPKEARRHRNGTGRLAHLCLAGSELLEGVDFTGHPRVDALLADPALRPVVLFPDPAPLEPDRGFAERLRQEGRTLLVFVIDGYWTNVLKMMKVSANLAPLPRFSLRPAAPSRFIIRHQPHPWCLSTIEAVHALIEQLAAVGIAGSGGRHHVLLDLCDRLVEGQVRFIRENAPHGRRRQNQSPVRSYRSSVKIKRRLPFAAP
jgi:DTW domain-containing protein YfiP